MNGDWHVSSAECMDKQKKYSASAMDKIGTDVPGSSRKGRDSLSPVLVEYPGGSLFQLMWTSYVCVVDCDKKQHDWKFYQD